MMTFKVIPDGGEPYQVTAHSRDVLVWEKSGKGRTFSQLADHLSMTDMYGLAYTAARRQGMSTGTLQDFEQSVDMMPVDVDGEDDEDPDPTPAAPSAAPSSNLPSPPASRPPSGQKRATGRS
jgi:hypothetical protein